MFLGGLQDGLQELSVFNGLVPVAAGDSLGFGELAVGFGDDVFDLFFGVVDAQRTKFVVRLVKLGGSTGRFPYA